MGDLISLLESPGLPPVVQLLLYPFALIGAALTVFKAWERLVHLVRHRLTHRAKYDTLKRVETALDRDHVESFLGKPQRTAKTRQGRCKVALYAEPEYILKLVYDQRGKIGMYSVTVRDPSFKPTFRVATDEYRLGEVTYADFPAEQVLYATYSSKDFRYSESCYLANPGGYQDLLLATHCPPGTMWDSRESNPDIASLCYELHLEADEYRHVLMQDETVAAVREEARPNCFGFAAMGFDEAGRIAVGAVYQHVRPLLRQG